jgi:hypothetical protein
MNNSPSLAKASHGLGWLALLIAVALNGVLAAMSVQFFSVPSGAFIRPMASAFWSLLIWACGFFAVLGTAVIAAGLQRTFVLSFLAVSLGIVAFFVPGWLLHLAAHINGFIVAQ